MIGTCLIAVGVCCIGLVNLRQVSSMCIIKLHHYHSLMKSCSSAPILGYDENTLSLFVLHALPLPMQHERSHHMLLSIRVETDPQRLWVGPASRAAQEKAAYEASFGPFYRITQIILSTTPDSISAYRSGLTLILELGGSGGSIPHKAG